MIAARRRLLPATVCLAAEALALAVAIELALRLMPFERLLDRLHGIDGPARGPARARRVDYDRLRRAAAAVYSLLPVRTTCLRESLVLMALLRRRGQPARLKIGVRKNGVAVAAHAWVESARTGLAAEASEFFPLTPFRPEARSPEPVALV